MLFQKEHLRGNYTWSSDADKAMYTGSASRRIFDKMNGDQVLFIINLYSTSENEFNAEDARKLEELIVWSLPATAKSEISVFNWLKESFSKGYKTNY